MGRLKLGTRNFKEGGLSGTLLISALLIVVACGGSDLSEEASGSPSGGAAAAASAGSSSTAPMGTGFIMMSGLSQLQLTEASYLEESDCAARVSALGDAEAYAGCMEIPPAALCIQLSEGTRESDKWWECFVEPAGCEEVLAAHEVISELGGYVREILLRCAETEMATVFASM